MTDLSREFSVAIELALVAGERVLEHYNRPVQVDYKDAEQTDPVTQADRDANRIIVDGLMRAFPNDGILAEESTDSASRLSAPRLWCVDPVDGTREFLDKNGMFVVMIGLAIEGKATAGVVYQPTERRLWWGSAEGSWERVDGKAERPLRVSDATDPADSVMMVSRSHRSEAVTKVCQSVGIGRELPAGSVGLKVAHLAMGTANAYLSLTTKTQEWDICAPEAILVGAGGRVTDTLGNDLVYNKTEHNTPGGILATSGPLHDSVVAARQALIDA